MRLVDLVSVNPFELASVPLDQRNYLPERPCVYFVIDSEEQIQYIGLSRNPKKRWSRHHRYSQLKQLDNIRIAYLESEESLLEVLEHELIKRFDPPLNGTPTSENPNPKNTYYVKAISLISHQLITIGMIITTQTGGFLPKLRKLNNSDYINIENEVAKRTISAAILAVKHAYIEQLKNKRGWSDEEAMLRYLAARDIEARLSNEVDKKEQERGLESQRDRERGAPIKTTLLKETDFYAVRKIETPEGEYYRVKLFLRKGWRRVLSQLVQQGYIVTNSQKRWKFPTQLQAFQFCNFLDVAFQVCSTESKNRGTSENF